MALKVGELYVVIGLNSSQLDKQLADVHNRVQGVGDTLAKFGGVMTAAVTVPLIAIGKQVLKIGNEFESAFAGVRKTVDATEAGFTELREGIIAMTREIPATANEIAGVAEAAGQLGISEGDILSFTKTMTNLGVTTNLTAEQAATSLARFANITQMPQENFERLGSTIVSLGNNFATTESEIVEMGQRLAAAGSQVGLSEAEIMGLATALSSIGINAEAGGSAMSRVMYDINTAVIEGGEGLAKFATVAGMSASQFATAWKTDPAAALDAFIQGLARADKQGLSTVSILDELGFSEIRTTAALNGLANAGDLTTKTFATANQAWEENTALAKEAEERYKTFDSQMQLLKNAFSELAIRIRDAVIPALTAIVGAITPVIHAISDWVAQNPGLTKIATVFLAVAAAIGPVTLAIGGVIKVLPILSAGFAAITSPVGIIIAAIGGLIAIFVKLYNSNKEFADNVNAIWSRISSMFSNVARTITSAISGLAQNMFGQGSNIGAAFSQGVGKGLIAVGNQVLQVVASLANNIMRTFRGILGIHSPSTEGESDGENFDEGVARGIEKNVKRPLDAVRKMAEDLKSEMDKNIESLERLGSGIIDALKNKYESAYKATTDSLKKQAEAVKKSASDQTSAIKDSVKAQSDAMKKSAKEQSDALKKSGKDAVDALKSSLKQQMDAIKSASEANIKQYKKEYEAKRKLLDKETDSAVKGLEDQIGAIDAMTEAEDEAARLQEHHEKLSELNSKLATASAEEAAEIQKEINELIGEEERRQLLRTREEQKKAIAAQIDGVKEAASAKQDALKEEEDAVLEAEQNKTDATLEALETQSSAQIEALEAQNEAQQKALDAQTEAAEAALDAQTESMLSSLDEQTDAKLAAIDAQLDAATKSYEAETEESKLRAEARKLIMSGNQDEILDLLQAYNPRWQDAGQSLSDALMNGVLSETENMKTAIGQAIDLAPVIEGQRAQLATLETQIASLEAAGTKAAGGGGGGGVGGLGSAISGLGADAATTGLGMDQLGLDLVEMDTNAANTAAAIGGIGTSFDGVSTVLSGIGASFATAFGDIQTTITAAKDAIVPIVTDLWNMVTGEGFDLQGKLDIAAGIVSGVWNGISTALGDVWSNLNLTAQSIFGEMQAFWEIHGAGVQESLTSAWNAIWSAIDAVWTIISDVAQTVWGALMGFWEDHGAKIIEVFRKAWEVIWLMTLKPIWDTISNVAKAAFGDLKKFWETWGENIKNYFKITWDTISGIFGGVLKVISGLFDVFIGLFTGDWERAWNGVKEVFSGIWDAIGSIFKGAINMIITGLNSAIIGINGMKVPDWVPVIGGQSPNIPTIPILHTGGVFETNNSSGEGLALLKHGEAVFTKQQQARLLALANGDDAKQQDNTPVQQTLILNLNLNNAMFTDQSMIDKLVIAVGQEMQSNYQLAVRAGV